MKKLFTLILTLLLIFVLVPNVFAEYTDFGDCIDQETGEDLGEHNFQLVGGKAATCTDEGKQIYQCTKCGQQYPVFSDRLSETGEHTYVEKIRDGSSCDEPQIKYDECTVCGAIANEVPFGTPKEHTYVVSDYTAPTCLKNGFRYYICSVCGHTNPEPEMLEKLGHNYQITAKKDATCTEDGFTTYTCANCGDSYDYIEHSTGTTGHNYEAKVEAATCTKAEKHYQQCTLCNYITNEEYVGEPLGHNYQITAKKDATCTEDGFTTYTCANCGDSYDYIEHSTGTTGHNYEAKVEAATCTKAEKHYQQCTLCNYITNEEYVGEPLGHAYVINNSTEKTCTEDGNLIYSCSVCGDTYVEFIYATGHEYVEKTEAATCTEDGYSYKECVNCGKKIDETTIAALGHDLSNNNYTCSRCGYKLVIEITFSTANITKAPEEEKKEEEPKEEEKQEEIIVIIPYEDEEEEEPLTRRSIQEDCPHEIIDQDIGDFSESTSGEYIDESPHSEYKCRACGKIWNKYTHYFPEAQIKRNGCHYTATCNCLFSKTYTLHDHITSAVHYTGKKSVRKVNGKAKIVYEVEVYRYCTTCGEKTENTTWYVSSKDSWTDEWSVVARNLYYMEDEYPEIESYWPQEVRRFIKKSKTQLTRN